MFAAKTRIEKKKYIVHPGTTLVFIFIVFFCYQIINFILNLDVLSSLILKFPFHFFILAKYLFIQFFFPHGSISIFDLI